MIDFPIKKITGTNNDGRKSRIFIFRNFINEIPVVVIRNPPIIEISVISDGLKNPAERYLAIRKIPPCQHKITGALNIIIEPKLAPKAIEETRSRVALASNIVSSPFTADITGPTTERGPMH